jgi:peptidoglycan/xylan/chitin deacetylase (PgdA/CDA1 family)
VRIFKNVLVRILASPGLDPLYRGLMRGRATIFMLHRFADPERGVEGNDPAALRRSLAYLRRQRYQILDLEEMFQRLAGEGPPLDRAVAFTIDDGFLEQATVACPVFAEFDCPVTTFVASGFLDGQLWPWWNQVEHIFESTPRTEVQILLGRDRLQYSLVDPGTWRAAREDFTSRCKLVTDEEMRAAILRLAEAAEVHVPARPPARYLPMSWDQLHECERHGMRFGPHTVTHPVLSRTSDDQSRREIEESWIRLRREAARPVPIFCYPNGNWEDFGTREMQTLRELGLQGAVSGVPGYAEAGTFAMQPDERYKVRRFCYEAELHYLAQSACGLERLKEILQGGRDA